MKKLLFTLLSIPLLAFGQGGMDFEDVDLPTGTSYQDGDFTHAGITYNYYKMRNQDNFPITDNGLMLGKPSESYFEFQIPNGVGEFSFQFRKAFTGPGQRQLELYANGDVVATSEVFGTSNVAEETIYTLTHNINLEGIVTIKIKNVGEGTSNRQTVIDNIVWTAYEAPEPITYCTPTFSTGCTSSDVINDFTVDGENGTFIEDLATGCSTGAYDDRTSIVNPVDFLQGENYSGSVATSTSGDYVTIWIDFNDDGEFTSNEMVVDAAGSSSFSNYNISFNLEVPIDANPGSHRMRVLLHYGTSSDITPCNDGSSKVTWGEVHDYTVNILELEACSGTPVAGTVEDIEVCGGVDFTLSTDGASTGLSGLTYQWSSSTDGATWTDITGANQATYTVIGGVSEETSYRLSVTCENSTETTVSDAIEITLKSAVECYCIPTISTSCTTDRIHDFELIGENGTEIKDLETGCSDGYDDRTQAFAPVDLLEASSYNAGIKTNSSGDYARIWIDFNDNGVFEASELVTNGAVSLTSGSLTNVPFAIPMGATPGEHRMRVRLNWNNSNFDACQTLSYGEAHDYIVNIEELDGCTGTPVAGTVEDIEICGGVDFTLSTDGVSTGLSGLTYQWSSSTDGTTWADIDGADAMTYTVVGGVNNDISYRLAVTCENGDETTYSDPIEVTIKAAADCYCEPEATNSSRYIDNFTTSGAIENIENTGSGFSPNGYGDYTSMTVKQVQGESVDFSTDIVGGTAGFKIWVDWNQNGTFEANEVAYSSTGYSVNHTNSFTVPLDALPGTTRMRIVSNWSNTTGGNDPCVTNYTLGEFEDYTFEVEELEACTGTPDAGTAVDFSICSGNSFTLSTEGFSEGLAGLSYQWSSSTDGVNWTEIEGATEKTYTVTSGITEATFYQLTVTCSMSGESASSNAIEVTLKDAALCPCIPIYTSTGDYISAFSTTGAETNVTYSTPGAPAGNYSDNSFEQITAFHGESFNFSTTYVGGANTVRVWIDWNQNGDFEANELVAVEAGSNATKNGTISIPLSVTGGEYLFRVRAVYGSSIDFDACGSQSYGSAIDYMLKVNEHPLCDATPVVGTVEDIEICGGTEFTLATSGTSEGASGIIFQWSSSTDGTTWTDIEGAVNPTHTLVNGINETTFFKLSVTCTGIDETVVSEVIEVTIKDAADCYCEPGSTNTSYYIDGFTAAGNLQSIDNNNSGASAGGYGDFTSMIVSQEAGESVTFSADLGSSDGGFRIWVDWNQNGAFEASEVVFSSSSYQYIHNGSFTVPMDALPGATRMRIASNWLNSAGNVDPCETAHSYGEFEDYTFVVESEVEPEVCEAPEEFFVDYEEGNSAMVVIEGDPTYTYEVIYGESGFDPATEGTSIFTDEDPIVEITGLDTDTEYDVYVRTVCDADENDYSNLVGPETFTTEDEEDEECETPDEFYVDEIDENSAWVIIDGDPMYSYEVIYGESGFNPETEGTSVFTDEDPMVEITGLDADTEYDVYVRTVCDADEDDYSNLVGPETFTTDEGEPAVDCTDFTATIDASATEICEGETVTLTANFDGNGTVVWSNGATDATITVTEGGTYSVTVTSDDDCEATASVDVVVNPLPTVGEITVVQNEDESYTFTVDADNATSYAWSLGDGNTSTEESPTHLYINDGEYTVTVTVTNDCGEASATTTVVYETSGIMENDLSTLSLFPNPAKDVVTISYNGSYEMTSVVVISPIGQKIMESNVNNGVLHQFSVLDLAPGLYHVNIVLANGDIVQRKFEVMK